MPTPRVCWACPRDQRLWGPAEVTEQAASSTAAPVFPKGLMLALKAALVLLFAAGFPEGFLSEENYPKLAFLCHFILGL